MLDMWSLNEGARSQLRERSLLALASLLFESVMLCFGGLLLKSEGAATGLRLLCVLWARSHACERLPVLFVGLMYPLGVRSKVLLRHVDDLAALEDWHRRRLLPTVGGLRVVACTFSGFLQLRTQSCNRLGAS